MAIASISGDNSSFSRILRLAMNPLESSYGIQINLLENDVILNYDV